MPKLIVEKGADRGSEIVISGDVPTVVGRESVGFRLKDTWSSRQHFQIESREDDFYLTDLKSLNGTFVNGRRVSETRLTFGDLIKVGETLFTFIGDGAKDALIGQRLAGYRVVERVGRGGMGTVYKAEQIDLQRTVAVKVISREFARDRDFIERFIHEARAAAQLNHPNVVQVYDVKRHQDIYFFSMEFMENGSLQTILGSLRKLPLRRAVKMILDVARGLEYAHQKEIVHRDVKPDNMMVSDTGSVKIGDLGLASGLHESTSSEDDRYVLGTPHYIAPEQLLGKPADFQSDIYSLGSSFYRILAGQPPFSGHGVQEIVNKKVREDPPPIDEVAPEVPPDVARIVNRMIERDRTKRYLTMGELVEDLEGVYDQLRAGEKSTSRLTGPTGGGALGWIVRRPAVAAAVAVAALLLMVVAGWAIFGGDATKPGPPPNPGGNGGGTRIVSGPKAMELAADRASQLLSENATPDEIRAVMNEYHEIIDTHKGSPEAQRAPEKIKRLEPRLQKAVRRKAIGSIREKTDRKNWEQFVAGVMEGTWDTEIISRVINAYRDLANQPLYKKTEIAKEANERADHIEGWLGAFNRLKKRLEETELKAARLKQAGNWSGAIREFRKFRKDYAPYAKWSFEEERYSDLLLDIPGRQRLRALGVEARRSFRQFRREIEGLVKVNDYDPALERLVERKDDFALDFLRSEFSDLRGLVEKSRDAYIKERDKRKQKELAERIARDKAAFDGQCRRVYESYTRTFRFPAAREALEELTGTLETELYRDMLKARLEALQAAEAFLEAFSKQAAAAKEPLLYPKEIATGGFTLGEKPITGINFTLRGFEIRDKDSTPKKLFQDFERAPWEFLEVLKAWPDPKEDRVALAYLAMEIGEYGEAEAQLERVKGDAEADALLDRLRNFTLNQSPEVQAFRRVKRIESCMAAKKYDAVVDELAVLKSHFAQTTVVTRESAEKIKEWSAEAKRLRGDQLRERERQQTLQRADRIRRQDREEIDALTVPIAKALKDAEWSTTNRFEENYVRGLYHFGRGEWRKAQNAFAESARIGRTMIPILRDDENQAERALMAFMKRSEVAALRKRPLNVPAAEQFAKQVFGRNPPKFFESWMSDEEGFAPWVETRKAFDQGAFKKAKKELDHDPSDPKTIWSVADGLFTVERDFDEARGWLKLLIEHYPDFEPVRSGEALYRFAECSLFLFDLDAAKESYDRFEQEHSDHDRAHGRLREDSSQMRQEMIIFLKRLLTIEKEN